MTLHFSREEFAQRQAAAKKAMIEAGLDGMIFFAQESHYYLTGYDTSGYVWFQCGVTTAGSDPYTLLIRMPDLQNARITSVCEDIRIWDDNGTNNPALELRSILAEMGLEGKRVGVELMTHALVASNYIKLADALEGFCELTDASTLVRALRSVKSNAEIAYVRKAAEIADEAMEAMIARTGPGAFEGDIAAAGQGVILRAGGDVAPSGPTIGSGFRALSGRASTGPANLLDTDQLTIEFAATYRRYNACLMRTILVGKVTPRQRELYDAVHGALSEAIDVARPGNRLGDVYDAHQAVFEGRGLGRFRRPSCGYSLGATYRPTWMDVPPMIQSSNDMPIVPNMVLFLHSIVMDTDTQLAMSLGRTVLTTSEDCEVLSSEKLDLLAK
ncbi:Xaa-Pro peptidase family protein [Ruegeria sp.]|uniref:M24 family metallopeptidase n=1 Tax=Ruegeria sp. TaxID=1879320 RepID=UPI0023207A03|nr:Xaa-Pro peptidase family protein [Ruegeria sp.]MDA7967002.1 Xaa-Pro peptidase family protein [Ruegeria sp.]